MITCSYFDQNGEKSIFRMLQSLTFRHFTQRHGLMVRPDVIEFLAGKLPPISSTGDDPEALEQLSQLIEFIASQYAASLSSQKSTLSQAKMMFVDRQALEAVVDRIFRTNLALRSTTLEDGAGLDARQYLRPLATADFVIDKEAEEPSFWRAHYQFLKGRLQADSRPTSIITLNEESHADREITLFGLLQCSTNTLSLEDLTGSVDLLLPDDNLPTSLCTGMFAVTMGTIVPGQKLAFKVRTLQPPILHYSTPSPMISHLFVEPPEQLQQIEQHLGKAFFLFLNDGFDPELVRRLFTQLHAQNKYPAVVFLVGSQASNLESDVKGISESLFDHEAPIVYCVRHDQAMPWYPQPPYASPAPSSLTLMNPARLLYCTQHILVLDAPSGALILSRRHSFLPSKDEAESSMALSSSFQQCKRAVYMSMVEQAYAVAFDAENAYPHSRAHNYLRLHTLPSLVFVNQRANLSECSRLRGCCMIAQNVGTKPVVYLYHPSNHLVEEFHIVSG
jgi:hypothetical protein